VKVLHLIPSIGLIRGGPSEAALSMVAALRSLGIEAALVSTDDNGPGRLALPTDRWLEHAEVPVRLFPRWSPPVRALREFAYSPALGHWLQQHLREWDLLHVHSLFSWPSTRGMVIARRQRVPYLIHCLGHLQPWSLRQSAWRKTLYLNLVERSNLNGATALQATSPLEAQDFARLRLRPPVLDLPLGVSIPEPLDAAPQQLRQAFPQVDPEAPTLLFLSRIHPKKGLDSLLEALALLRRTQPDRPWQLLIAGSGEPAYEQELQALAAELALADRCHWLGFVSGERKNVLLQGSDWFVLPSAAENFGVAVAEALAAGTPVILSPEVGLAAAVAAAGAGRLSHSAPEKLAHTLASALEEDRAPLASAARKLAVEHYSWSAVSGRLKTAYTQALASRPT
jgi:glycosyltransferase involved in cell wall biosynthesis